MSDSLSLREIEERLRQARVTRPARAPVPAVSGRPPTKREQAVQAIVAIARDQCGGVWDRPIPWPPIRHQLRDMGIADDTTRRAMRAEGIRTAPKGHPTLVYPPEREIRRAPNRIPASLAPAVEHGIEALADGLSMPTEQLAEQVTEQQARIEPEWIAERLDHGLGRVPALRRCTIETLVGHECRTVGAALDKGVWLDELVGGYQAERLRRYARGE